MGTLRDEVYEQLDYLSQLTEVVIGPQNEVLGAIPDRIDLTIDQIIRRMTYNWSASNTYDLNVFALLRPYVEASHQPMIYEIQDNFQFEVSPDFELDLETKTMVGSIALVKKNQNIDERKLLELAIQQAVGQLNGGTWPAKNLKNRVITVLNTLEPGKGTEWAKGLQGRVANAARNAIAKQLKHVILENLWRVREASVIHKMGSWINSYLAEEPNTLGLVNLMKLKIMIDKDLPVYSVDEVKKNGDAR